MNIIKLNESIRKEFQEFKAIHFEPNNKVLAKQMNVSYSNLMQWQKGKLEMGFNTLAKIKNFLDNHNTN